MLISKDLYKKIFIKKIKNIQEVESIISKMNEFGILLDHDLTSSDSVIKLLVLISGTSEVKNLEDLIYWWIFEDVEKNLYDSNTGEVIYNLTELEDFANYVVENLFDNRVKVSEEYERNIEHLFFYKCSGEVVDFLNDIFINGDKI
jgi:hypothetical protein